ncbi:hypothetical protein B9Q17_15275 [Marinobacter vinifirmus]|uniref:Uncharacterized protein n=1 Tax=Marinobacter vinifirmus TaxID=355591 RepID=A0A7Z1INU3_9GAMM|nr:hypothetical protein B9Q17_15275 [Marinobacter vinifirmus]
MLVGRAFQNCAEPRMAEPKRHMDVPKERVLESPTHKHLRTERKAHKTLAAIKVDILAESQPRLAPEHAQKCENGKLPPRMAPCLKMAPLLKLPDSSTSATATLRLKLH